MNIAIHASGTRWQQRYAPFFQQGLKKHGINTIITNSKSRVSDIAIILGPNYWKSIERDGGEYIMGNRKFLGFGDHVHNNLAISWNGFNGRGEFCVDNVDESRLSRYINIDDIREPQNGNYSLLCEQSDTGRCDTWRNINLWYDHIKKKYDKIKVRKKTNPELNTSWEENFLYDIRDVKDAHVLNSTVSIELLYYGIDVISHDIGDPCYNGNINNRLKLFHLLSNCQWHYEEIKNGDWWDSLKNKTGIKLHEIKL